jgi:hypothetical protein
MTRPPPSWPSAQQWAEPPAGLDAVPGHPYPPSPWGPPLPRPLGTNGMAIAALVLGLCAGPLGLVFGLIALSQIRRTGEGGRGMAIAGVVLGSLVTVLLALLVISAVLVVAGNAATRDDSGTIDRRGPVALVDLRVGDCIEDLDGADLRVAAFAVPCREPHEGEVFAVFDLPAGPYPGEDRIAEIAYEECVTRLGDYSATAAADPDVGLFHFAPQSRGWALGDREIVCIATWDTGPRAGPLPR